MIIDRLNKWQTKGEGLPSPFVCLILIILFINCCSAQFGTEFWLHPYIYTINSEYDSSYIQAYNDSHIGLVKYNGSINISNSRYGIKYEKKIVNKKFRIFYDKYRSITKFIEPREPNYSFKVYNNYYELLLGYELNRGKFITKLALSKNSEINLFSPSIICKTEINPRLILSIGKYIQKVPFELNLNYTDYFYYLDNHYMVHNINFIELMFIHEYYKLEFSTQLDAWEFNSSDALLSKINIQDGMIKEIYINNTFYLKDKKQVDIGYQNSYSKTEFDLIDSMGNDFVNVNKYTIENHIFLFKYLFSYSKYNVIASFYHRELDFILSDRVNLPQNYDFSALFNNSIFINNINVGCSRQNMISIVLKPKTKSNYNPIFQVDWIKDQYDIEIDTKGFALGIPLPEYIKNKHYNIIGKEAFNVNLGIILNLNHWIANASFSQHVPYKIDTTEGVPISEDAEIPASEETEKQKLYGGGKFNFSIIRYLD